MFSFSPLYKHYECRVSGWIPLPPRDYATLDVSAQVQLHHYGVRHVEGTRYVLLQVWELHEPLYDPTFYVIEHREGAQPVTHASQATYYAVPITRLMRLMEQAGCFIVCRMDGKLFEPVLVGCKRLEPFHAACGSSGR